MTAPALSPHPLDVSAEEITRLLEAHYGMTPSALTGMQSELSSVYRADRVGARSLAVKALPYTEEGFALAQWRIAAMDHLQGRGIPAGETTQSFEGNSLQRAQSQQGEIMIHVGEWLPGRPLEDVPPAPGVLREVGAVAAQVATGLASWPAPPVDLAHPWELTRTLDTLEDTVDAVRDPDMRNLIDCSAERFASRVNGALPQLPHTVLHHDLHDSNLLVDDAAGEVSGVLDFGDMVWGPRVAELAVAAGYGGRAAADPVEAFLCIVEGWGRVLLLDVAEAEVVFDAAIGRLAVNLSVWNARKGSERGDYARSRSARTERTLRAFLAADRSRVVEAVHGILC